MMERGDRAAPDLPGQGSATEAKEASRAEAFSDGVFAIAITLLVLDLKTPALAVSASNLSLAQALLDQWPVYLSYVISFVTILIMWVNHHGIFHHIVRTDHTFLLLNGLLLMGITIVPFPTALLAAYATHPAAKVATLMYSGLFVFIALGFNAVWHYASQGNRLLSKHVDQRTVDDITVSFRAGIVLYVLAFALALLNAPASIVLEGLLALFYALPRSIIRRKHGPGE